jgi:hypothetical protein
MSFDFNTGSKQESDPTADFLARERAAAGALEGDADLFGGSHTGGNNSLNSAARQASAGLGGDRDFENSASAFPALDGEDDGGFGAPATSAARGGGFMDDGEDDLLGGGAQSAQAPRVEDERDQFERNFPEIDEPEVPPPSVSMKEGKEAGRVMIGNSQEADGINAFFS